MRSRSYRFVLCYSLGLSLISLGGCTQKKDEQPPLSPAAQRGKAIYLSVCIACHNSNPKLDGTLGPAIAHSSLELLTDRILEGKYPAGYTPKRPGSKLMPQYPQYKNDIPSIYEYIKSASE